MRFMSLKNEKTSVVLNYHFQHVKRKMLHCHMHIWNCGKRHNYYIQFLYQFILFVQLIRNILRINWCCVTGYLPDKNE